MIAVALFAQSGSAQTTLYSGSSTSTMTWGNTSPAVWATGSTGPFDQSWQDGAKAFFLNSGNVTVSGTINSVDSIVLGGKTLSGGVITLTGSATISGAGQIGDLSGNGRLTGSAGLRKAGNGTIVLRGAADYTGDTFIEDGTLQLGTGNDRLPRGTVVTLGSGASSGILWLGAATTTREQTLAGLLTAGSGAGNIVRGGGSSTFSKLTLNIASGTNAYGGRLGDTGSSGTNARLDLVKQGAGRLVLSASSPYVGSTLISAGVLEISATGLVNSTSGITLDGATAEFKYNSATALTRPLTLTQGVLSGTGTIGSAVSFNAGDILAPGDSPGTQSYTSLHAWAPGGTYQWEFNALSGTPGVNWDFVNVSSGTFNLSALAATPGNQFTLDLVTLDALDVAGSLATPYAGGSFTLPIASYDAANFLLPDGFSNTPGADLTSLFTFADLPDWQGPKPQIGDISVKINSSATGIDLVIVPEPGAFALAGLGAALAGWRLRRRRPGLPAARRLSLDPAIGDRTALTAHQYACTLLWRLRGPGFNAIAVSRPGILP